LKAKEEDTMANTEKVEIKQVLQICVVVKDLQKTMERYWNICGIGPWQIYTFGPPDLTNTTVRGKQESYSLKIAATMIGDLMWELVQPLSGPSTFKEFLEEKGEGLHHVQVVVDDFDKAVATLGSVMDGTLHGVRLAYLDTEKDLGAIFEVLKPLDFELPPPEATYPPSR
jgi:methylmalonyl-CoA/ethylmalonyl-CoA epimerase